MLVEMTCKVPVEVFVEIFLVFVWRDGSEDSSLSKAI